MSPTIQEANKRFEHSNMCLNPPSPTVPTDVLWIGLNDQKNQMLFEWSDGSHVTFTQWTVGEPSHTTNLQEDCVHIRGKVTSRILQTRVRTYKVFSALTLWPCVGREVG